MVVIACQEHPARDAQFENKYNGRPLKTEKVSNKKEKNKEEDISRLGRKEGEGGMEVRSQQRLNLMRVWENTSRSRGR